MLAGKEIIGKSSVSVGGGEEVAGVLEAGVPFPPAKSKRKKNVKIPSVSDSIWKTQFADWPDVLRKRLVLFEALWDSSALGDMLWEDGGVAMPHNEVGLHSESFPPQEELSSKEKF